MAGGRTRAYAYTLQYSTTSEGREGYQEFLRVPDAFPRSRRAVTPILALVNHVLVNAVSYVRLLTYQLRIKIQVV